jgi:PTH1 family peptidyl-tRNA hydrolase
MLLLVGLGNPGPRHAGNRHNIGFMAVDEVVRRYGFGPWRTRFSGRVAEGRIEGGKVLALEPETYMNESGRAVGEAVRFYKLEPETQVIVIYDEIDLKPGKVKVKLGGGAGGHNGIRSIDSHIGRDYRRLRLGVGHPGDKDLVHGHVLQDFAKVEVAGRDKLIDAVAAELPRLIAGDDSGFMSRLAHIMNPPKPKPPKPEAEPEARAKTEAGPKAGPETEEDADGL